MKDKMTFYTVVDYVKELEIRLLDAGKQLPLMRDNVVHLIDGELKEKQTSDSKRSTRSMEIEVHASTAKLMRQLGAIAKHSEALAKELEEIDKDDS